MNATQNNLEREVQKLREELAATKKELKDTKMVFSTILESSLAGYWDWYIKEDYEYLSPTFKMMFGYKDHEMRNHPDEWQKIIHPDDLESVFEVFNRHVESRGRIPYSNEVRYYHKDGSIVWVYCKGEVVEWNDAGEPVRMIGCHIDITSLKKAQAHLKEQTHRLIQKNMELEQFAYVASHDLQEPLNTVTNFVHIFENEYQSIFDEPGKLYLNYITQASRRMKELITALLDYSRIGRERKLALVNSTEVVKDIMSDMQLLIKKTATEIYFESLPSLQVYPTEFRLLLQNLISNAIKFRKKSETPVIYIKAKEEENAWRFSVMDNGIGFDKQYSDRIFVIFQRLHAKHKYEGSGIGLAHCKKIIELHGGEIWVRSTPNQGTTFYFSIPKQYNS